MNGRFPRQQNGIARLGFWLATLALFLQAAVPPLHHAAPSIVAALGLPASIGTALGHGEGDALSASRADSGAPGHAADDCRICAAVLSIGPAPLPSIAALTPPALMEGVAATRAPDLFPAAAAHTRHHARAPPRA